MRSQSTIVASTPHADDHLFRTANFNNHNDPFNLLDLPPTDFDNIRGSGAPFHQPSFMIDNAADVHHDLGFPPNNSGYFIPARSISDVGMAPCYNDNNRFDFGNNNGNHGDFLIDLNNNQDILRMS